MRYTDAAEKAWLENQRPIHSIVQYAKKLRWISPRGKTPDHGLQAALWKDMKKRGRNTLFVMTRGRTLRRKYALRSLEKK
jgi:hypothetical protein